jgi:hypothetical protein
MHGQKTMYEATSTFTKTRWAQIVTNELDLELQLFRNTCIATSIKQLRCG